VKCAVCSREARHLGWFNPRLKRNDPARYSDRWVFCSKACQNAFSQIMNKTEGQMVDPSEMEIAAMHSCLLPLGEFVGAIGMTRALADYSREEILTLVEVVVTAYQNHMLAEHEREAAKDRAYFERLFAEQERTSSMGNAK
jgi:hypothetical protein